MKQLPGRRDRWQRHHSLDERACNVCCPLAILDAHDAHVFILTRLRRRPLTGSCPKMAAEGSSTSASDAAGNKAVHILKAPASPQQHPLHSLPPPSSPSSVLRRKMASNAPKKDPVPPRRPATSSSTAASAGARRPAAAAAAPPGTTTRPPSSASRALAGSTSRLTATGPSLNKPPTRAPAGTAARRTGLASKPAPSDAEPELSSVTSGDENRKPAVRRTLGGAGAAGAATPSARRSTITPSTAAATKRPSTTARPSAESAATRATPRASLASSTAKPAAPRLATTARTPHHIIPKAPVSTITPRTPVAHAKKLSINSVPSPSKASVAEALT